MWFQIIDNVVDLRYQFSNIVSTPVGLKAAKGAVSHIMQNFPGPYHIMVSGGIDSQATLQSWIEYGHNWQAWHIVYNTGINKQDTSTVTKLEEKWKLEINRKEFDVINCHLSKHDYLAQLWQCPSPQITTYIDMTENFSGTVIMGGAFVSDKSFYFDNSQYALLKVAQQRKNFIPFFLTSTPELAYSVVHLNLLNDSKYKFIDPNYSFKVQIYKDLGFDIIPQAQKYTGFEFVKDYWDERFRKDITPMLRLKYSKKPSKRAHDILLRYPYEDKFPEPKWKFLLNDYSQ